MLREDYRNKFENGWCWGRRSSVYCKSVIISIFSKGLNVAHQYEALFERGVQRSTRVRKAQVVTRQTNPLGRSMIEMLGVLAIIAVLSVGGIAGYSKAMLAYKSNIQREMLSELLRAMIEIKPKLGTNLAEFQNITELFYSLGYLPEGTTYKNNTIFDKSGNKIQIHKYYSSRKDYVMEIYFRDQANSLLSFSSEELCRNIVWATKPIADEIYFINFWQDVKDSKFSPVLFNHDNLAKATLADIQSKCHLTTTDGFNSVHYSIHLYP